MVYLDQIARRHAHPRKKAKRNEDSLHELKKTQKQKYIVNQNKIKLL